MREATGSDVLGLDFLRTFETTILYTVLSTKDESEARELPNDDEPLNQVRGHDILNFSNSCHSVDHSEEDSLQVRIRKFLETELPKFQQI